MPQWLRDVVDAVDALEAIDAAELATKNAFT
jgi:hypothetical protein